MRKNTLTIVIALLFSAGCLVSCADKKENVPALLERKKVMGPDEEKVTIRKAYDKAIEALKNNPNDLQQYITLASAYISEGRITGDNTYYSNAAIKMLDHVTDTTTANKDLVFQSLSLRSAIYLNMHQFKDAYAAAQKGVALNSFNAGIYGALVDANVELGNYDEAVADCDKMISIRPDLRSYSRASYLRQIFGQNTGAIEAMKMAVEAGVPGAESTEWARTKLADLYLDNGNADSARILYRTSLVYRADYPFALIGLARVERSKKDYNAAIAYTKSAIKVLSEAAFVTQLADLYELQGNAEQAKQTRNDVVGLLEQAQKNEPADALVKHNVSREMATAYLNAGNLDRALSYAQTDLAMRPENIDANELAAWIYYMKGDYVNALAHGRKMLKTNSRNANTLYKAGVIFASAGEAEKGKSLMREALAVNPDIDQRLVAQAKVPVNKVVIAN